MRSICEYIDERTTSVCCYCGTPNPQTVDHVPAKAFLDEPYPDNLRTVKACLQCNNKYSVDEEYVACFLEALACGSTENELLERKKTVSAFEHSPTLRKKIQDSLHFDELPCYVDAGEFFDRFKGIAEKTAIALARWYGGINAKCFNTRTFFMDQLPADNIEAFENVGLLKHEVYPEVASRLLVTLAETSLADVKWEVIQLNRFRFSIWQRSCGMEIRMVFREICGAVTVCSE